MVPIVQLNRLSHSPDEPCDPFPFAERHQTFVGDELLSSDLILIPLHHALRCHSLKQQGQGRPCFLRHPQSTVDLYGAETVTGLVRVHRQGAEHCPLIGGTEGLAVGDGSKHGCLCG